MKRTHTVFSKCTQNMRLRNQLILIASLQAFIIISYVLAQNMIHLSLVNVYFQDASNKLYKENTDRIQSTIIKFYRSYFDKVFYLSKKYLQLDGNTLVQFHRLYHYTKKQVLLQNNFTTNEAFQMLYGGTNPIPDPLRIIKGYGNFDISNCFMCYSNLSSYSVPMTIDELVGIKMQEQVQAYGQLLYQGNWISQNFVYSYIVKEKITSIYPCLNRQQAIYSYKPEQRDWYIELKKNYDSSENYNTYNYKFTKPFMLFTEKVIGLVMTMPIVDEQVKLIGGVASAFLGNDFVQEVGQKKFGFQIIYLISSDGIMIMHPYHVSKEYLPLYIFNQTITGFNQTDWEEIKKHNGSSTCPKFELLNSPLQCRFNSLYNQEMIIGMQTIHEFKLILIMLSSSREYLEFYYQFENQLQDNLQGALSINIITLFAFLILACICICIMIQILFFPIYMVQDCAVNLMSQKKKKLKTIPLFILKCMSKQVRQLLQTFTFIKCQLEQLSFRKTEQCSFIENIQFPRHNISFLTHLQQYQNFIRIHCLKKVKLYQMEKIKNNKSSNQNHQFCLKQIQQIVRKVNFDNIC